VKQDFRGAWAATAADVHQHLAAGTRFHKGKTGILTKQSLQLDADPSVAAVEACFSNRVGVIRRSCIRNGYASL
jgi:hypothetical protein